MQPKGLNITRLTPEKEDQVNKILDKAMEEIRQDLYSHFNKFDSSVSDNIFSNTLQLIGRTIAQTAALSFFSEQNKKKFKRISFLPGYTKKNKQRISYYVNNGNIFIPSDIAFLIEDDGIKDVGDVTNFARLYNNLLHYHTDDKTFVNGGTHQFLISNSKFIRSNSNYHIDLLEVQSVKKEKITKDEMTFLTLVVEFQKYDTVEKLYSFFNSELNKNSLPYKWPYNMLDSKKKSEELEPMYKMRGYLVALWFKLLFDANTDNADQWFKDCSDLSESLRYNQLTERIEKTKSEFKKNTDECYQFWYSLVFNPMPDFKTKEVSANDTIGSAMILSDFQLYPNFFFYIQNWINRVYRLLREFETLIHYEQEILEDVCRNIFVGPHYPKKVHSDRLLSPNPGYGYERPIGMYYQHTIERGNQVYIGLYEKAYEEAEKALNLIAKAYFYYLAIKATRQEYGAEIKEYQDVIDTQNYELGKINIGRDYKKCKEFDAPSIAYFCDRLFGRTFTLGCFLCLGMSCGAIHTYVCKTEQPNFDAKETDIPSRRETRYDYMMKHFFIEGFVSDNKIHSATLVSKGNIVSNLSQHEKEFLARWWNYTFKNLESILDLAPPHTLEKVKKTIIQISIPDFIKAETAE